jgi:hypothetical protein
VTHFRFALGGKMLKWYNALPKMDVDNLLWENGKAQFELEDRFIPTVS